MGYGPRTQAWLIRPEGSSRPLPAIIALHDHGGFKYSGKEKIARGPNPVAPFLAAFQRTFYGGRSYANALAKAGFAVLVPDVFLWGSRRFDLAAMPPADLRAGRNELVTRKDTGKIPKQVATYNACASFHEHTVAKYCQALGTTLAGMVAYEDRIAVRYLLGRTDICDGKIGSVGLSGGGMRSALLHATCPNIAAAVVVGMMSTYEELLDRHVCLHTWMIYPGSWSRTADWPDWTATRAPSPLLVQYNLNDPLFSLTGMKKARRRLQALYRAAGNGPAYQGEFYSGPHKFDTAMQERAFAWLAKRLPPPPSPHPPRIS